MILQSLLVAEHKLKEGASLSVLIISIIISHLKKITYHTKYHTTSLYCSMTIFPDQLEYHYNNSTFILFTTATIVNIIKWQETFLTIH